MKSRLRKRTTARSHATRGLPFVFINMAMTADGKTASANRAISTFGSKRDHHHLYELRSTADAVICGARTIDLNPVQLGSGGKKYERLRVKNGLAQFSLRVIVSGSGSVNPRAEIFKHRFSPILIITTERAGPRKLKLLKSLADEVFIGGKTEIDFPSVLRWLKSKWKV
ncbi:MAG: dihydrofolate reductase family protein, partial [Opitutaceae bacterium]|nr:dihydrofolate reductase family protein [Verrucomicrobiales bacterium]